MDYALAADHTRRSQPTPKAFPSWSMILCALQAIQRLSDVYVKQKDAEALRKLLTELRPLFGVITKAKTAKIVRNIIEAIAKVPNSTQLQVRYQGQHYWHFRPAPTP